MTGEPLNTGHGIEVNGGDPVPYPPIAGRAGGEGHAICGHGGRHAARMPGAEWARCVMRTRGAAGAPPRLRPSAARQLRAPRRRGGIPAEAVAASGMHGILRYGRMVLRWLVRARPGRGPARRERHTAAQCAANRKWAAPGAVPGDSVEVALSTVCGRAGAACARAGVRPVLLMDREFLAAGVAGRLGGTGVRWAMPCHSGPRVAAAPREYAARRRRRVSAPRISDGRGRVAPRAMAVAKRRKPEGESPEGAHIAFAAAGPSLDAGPTCPRRWRTGIGHRMARQTRIRTPGRDERARTFCLVLSPMAHNAWTIMRPGRRARGDGRGVPRSAFRTLLVPGACTELAVQGWRRPPRKPPPRGARAPQHLGSVMPRPMPPRRAACTTSPCPWPSS